jgi:hypothetical protein
MMSGDLSNGIVLRLTESDVLGIVIALISAFALAFT